LVESAQREGRNVNHDKTLVARRGKQTFHFIKLRTQQGDLVAVRQVEVEARLFVDQAVAGDSDVLLIHAHGRIGLGDKTVAAGDEADFGEPGVELRDTRSSGAEFQGRSGRDARRWCFRRKPFPGAQVDQGFQNRNQLRRRNRCSCHQGYQHSGNNNDQQSSQSGSLGSGPLEAWPGALMIVRTGSLGQALGHANTDTHSNATKRDRQVRLLVRRVFVRF